MNLKLNFRLNFKSILILILSGGILSCAPEKSGSSFNIKSDQYENIIGGQDLSLKSEMSPTVAVLLDTSSAGSFSICTGTFIRKNIILTAAHCVPENSEDLAVKMGNSLFNEQEIKTLNVLKIIRHKDYQPGKNDLALVLIQPDKNIFIKPAALSDAKKYFKNKNLLLFGYGDNEIDEAASDDLKGAGSLRKLIVSAEYISHIENKFIIDQSHGFGACHGDSGGPAFILNAKNKYVLAGVASGVRQTADQTDCTGQSEYTDVSKFQTWISQSISDFNRN